MRKQKGETLSQYQARIKEWLASQTCEDRNAEGTCLCSKCQAKRRKERKSRPFICTEAKIDKDSWAYKMEQAKWTQCERCGDRIRSHQKYCSYCEEKVRIREKYCPPHKPGVQCMYCRES